MNIPIKRPSAAVAASVVLAALALAAVEALPALGQPGSRAVAAKGFRSQIFATATGITHATPKGEQAISGPDDITSLNGRIYVGFQNGVGPQGQASTTGNEDSTIVAFTTAGRPVAKWDLVGKCDGLTADPATGRLIATVNEDANSSIYVIDPAGAAVHYRYDVALPSHGGTDAIEVHDGMVLLSASAPGTSGNAAPQPSYPAVYRTTFDAATHVATIKQLFYDESEATVANTGHAEGHKVRLKLTDPDSSEDVPSFATRFAGDFMLTSQGDEEQIFVHDAGGPHQTLSVLKLSASVDDTTWASDSTGAIYTTDNSNDSIYKITGPFQRGEVFAAETPCDENGAPSACPGPGYPANFLARLNPETGALTAVGLSGPKPEPQGMLFLP